MFLLVNTVSMGLGQAPQDDKAILALQTQLIEIINAKHIGAFLALISPSGVTFGVDGDQQFRQQVQEQFDQKRDAYCVLFDSKCLSRETPRKRMALPPCSVHDLIRRPDGWSMEHQISQSDGTTLTHLILKPNNENCSNGRDPVEFVFTEAADGWKLVAVGYE
jgi:hypothetical protein